MAYDEALADRMRRALRRRRGVTECKMFGGLAFLVNGHMCAGIVKDELMVRVGPDATDAALAEPPARPMDFTGRPLRGMLYVGTAGFESDEDLDAWLRRATAFTKTLPRK